jgi:hypothetical protein
LVKLELQPVHDALRAQLAPDLVRFFADLAGHSDLAVSGIGNKTGVQRSAFFSAAWACCETFLRRAQKAYRGRIKADAVQPVSPSLLRAAFRERLSAVMRLPAVEALFPAPWTAGARRVLPSPSPQLSAAALWGPVLGWCALHLLAETIDLENPQRIALDLFDRLRLREPFAEAFNALGFEGEDGWRVAARIKVVLLIEAGVGKPEEAPVTEAAEGVAEEPAGTLSSVSEHDFSRAESAGKSAGPLAPAAMWPALWSDPDVRWLTGVHEAEGHSYLVREQYEELLWWLQMPSLLRLAGEALPSPMAVAAVSRAIEDSLATAEAAGYRVDRLSGAPVAEAASDAADSASEPVAESAPKPEVALAEAPSPLKKQESAEQGSEPQPNTKVDPA